jgi:hypothetical protein
MELMDIIYRQNENEDIRLRERKRLHDGKERELRESDHNPATRTRDGKGFMLPVQLK